MAIHAERNFSRRFIFYVKGNIMKTIKRADGSVDGSRVALLLGLSVGLGIVVHEAFFLVAGAIAVGALTVAAVHAVEEHSERTHLAHQHH